MRIRIILLLCAAVFAVPTGVYGKVDTLVKIDRVIDGNTFKLSNGKKVRLIGVDAPEDERNSKAKEDSQRLGKSVDEIIELGKKATEWVKTHFEGKEVFLRYDVRKEDDREVQLAYVYFKSLP